MRAQTTRRRFLQIATVAAGSAATGRYAFAEAAAASEPPFRISLAEFSLHRALRKKKLTNLDFPVVARQEFGIDAVEYVNSFFKDKARDAEYLAELNRRCEGEGVRNLLIM
ncbi:MAG: sugar phosphate isomerase/epimerase, partial [Planctomycetota bacterium]